MAKPASPTNTNSKDLPVLATKGGAIVLPLAGYAQAASGLDYSAAPQVVVGGQADDASYVVDVSAQANTAATEAITIEAPAGNAVRIQRVEITQPGKQTTAGIRVLSLLRTTTAGTGGTVTPAPLDTADGAYPGICRAKPTAGTESTVLATIPVYVPTALAAFVPITIDFSTMDSIKCPVIPAGTANGIALKDPGAAGASDFSARIWFTVV